MATKKNLQDNAAAATSVMFTQNQKQEKQNGKKYTDKQIDEALKEVYRSGRQQSGADLLGMNKGTFSKKIREIEEKEPERVKRLKAEIESGKAIPSETDQAQEEPKPEPEPIKEETIIKPSQRKTKKQASDYLYLDLRPSGGKDLKAYVTSQAHKESAEQGKNISATAYIQNLIEKDMASGENTETKQEIKNMLDNADDDTLEQIHGLLKRLITR